MMNFKSKLAMLAPVLGAKDILDDPVGSGATHPVFEVHAV